MRHLILPRELKQEHKTYLIILKILKVARKKFTWNGGEIPHIGRYGGNIWQYFGFWELYALVEFILSTW